MSNRRTFLQRLVGAGAALIAAPRAFAQGEHAGHRETQQHSAGKPVFVNTPDIPNLPFTMDGNVKVFKLVAEVVERELVPGRKMKVWGYNGSVPGPTIQVTQGDRVRVILENRLPEPTTMHWHGFEIPVGMDGMPYISQQPILPGQSFAYEFNLHQEGTFFYHSHGAMQEMLGMIGMFIMHPKQSYTPHVDHDFGIILQGWAILPNNDVPNPAGMEFNWLTFNGKAGPATTPMLVKLGDRVRIRFVNLGMDHHPMHVHGHTFAVTGTEGGRIQQAGWAPGNTVLVGVAQARDIEFVANNPGDWMVHCHLPHHMMNSMMDLMSERMFVTGPLTQKQADEQMGLMMAQGLPMGAHGAEAENKVSQNANQVPGFPEDVFMEMAMDSAVAVPETYGLPRNWTAGMQGMMSLLRVLPPDKYDAIMARVRNRKNEEPMQHQHGGR